MHRAALLLFFALASVPSSQAGLVGVEIAQRTDILDGKPFGLAGPYEKISGTLRFAVDPANPANRIINDLELAPRNADGKVEFSSDFYVIKPKDASRGNHAVLLEIGNRGRKGLLGFFNFANGSLDPSEPAHFGDGFLLERGYTLLWVGWQFDPPETDSLMRVRVPFATESGKLIRGLVRSNFAVTDRVFHHSLADRNHIPYPVADPNDARNTMTVRDRVEAEPEVISRERWRFARMQDGKAVTDAGHVYLEGGFERNKIYEVVYLSENPPVVGLGPAAVRDTVSRLKYGGIPEWNVPDGAIDRAHAFGVSQSGRFLRTFLYYGYNRDESEHKVFDGILSHVAGAGRGSFNHRFAQPSRDAHPFMNFFYPTDIFPFTDVEQSDLVSGLTDGLLSHALEDAWTPKIYYTNSAYEYWGRSASLIHTTIDGKKDAPIRDNVRIYSFAGTEHGPDPFPPKRSIGQQRNNPLDFRWSMRALLEAMDRWTASGEEPPPSQYGRIADSTLTTPEKLNFPKIPGVNYSTRIHKAYRVDFGPEFYSDGIVTLEPPEIGPAFPMMVTAADADGNDVAGVRMPELLVPLATFTGWNLFNENYGPTDEIASMVGSYVPFPRTKREREQTGDPRRSIEERYGDRDRYLGQLAEATLDMAARGYLLDEDVPELLEHGAQHWDYLMGEVTSKPSDSRE